MYTESRQIVLCKDILCASPLHITEGPFNTTIKDLTEASEKVTCRFTWPMYYSHSMRINFFVYGIKTPFYTYRIEKIKDLSTISQIQTEFSTKQISKDLLNRLTCFVLECMKDCEEFKPTLPKQQNPFAPPRRYYPVTIVEQILVKEDELTTLQRWNKEREQRLKKKSNTKLVEEALCYLTSQ